MPLYQPICVKCKKEYRVEKNGVFVLDTDNTLYSGDLWKCPICQHEIIKGFGNGIYKGTENYETLLNSAINIEENEDAGSWSNTLPKEPGEYEIMMPLEVRMGPCCLITTLGSAILYPEMFEGAKWRKVT